MNFVKIPVVFDNGYEARLLFRQFQHRGDWICQASDECMTDIQDLLAGESLSWQDTPHDPS
jgi:hypothetical protein